MNNLATLKTLHLLSTYFSKIIYICFYIFRRCFVFFLQLFKTTFLLSQPFQACYSIQTSWQDINDNLKCISLAGNNVRSTFIRNNFLDNTTYVQYLLHKNLGYVENILIKCRYLTLFNEYHKVSRMQKFALVK